MIMFLLCILWHLSYSIKLTKQNTLRCHCTTMNFPFLGILMVVCYLYLIWVNFVVSVPKDIFMKHPVETVRSITEVSPFVDTYKPNYQFYNRSSNNVLFLGTELLLITYFMIKQLSWHSGTSVFVNTVSHALADLLDVFTVLIIILVGLSGFGFAIFGTWAGSIDYQSFHSSLNTMARLSFGMYEYYAYMSDNLGQGYEGIGMGSVLIINYILLWSSFIFT